MKAPAVPDDCVITLSVADVSKIIKTSRQGSRQALGFREGRMEVLGFREGSRHAGIGYTLRKVRSPHRRTL
jgi:hypothetical protein